MPKPGSIPKFSLPSLVMPCPFLLHAQACGSTSAITKFTQRTVFLEKTSGILSSPAQYAQVGRRALVLNWIQSARAHSPRLANPLGLLLSAGPT